MYNLVQAGTATGKSKSTILQAIRRGTISAKQGATGRWEIDPSELHRVYPPIEKTPKTGKTKQTERHKTRETNNTDVLIEVLQREREREREQLEATIRDLRARLDKEGEERARLTQLLTHQAQPPRRRTLFERIFGA